MDARIMRKIERVAATCKKGDLYRALHHVGDDTTKSEIEEVLYEVLDSQTLAKVVAVFKIATSE